jgi:predicted RNA binding protein YcfA (HicA-like mRNA interferase family)
MKSASGRVLTKALERNGWLLLRVHGDRPLKTGLLRHLLGLAELSEDDL